jgi:hypothetical protein
MHKRNLRQNLGSNVFECMEPIVFCPLFEIGHRARYRAKSRQHMIEYLKKRQQYHKKTSFLSKNYD